jgi:RND family efflux transporter MFP subunit
VRVAPVSKKMVSDQIELIGTTEAIAISTIASERSGVVESFPVKAGDFVEKGQLLTGLRDTEVKLRLKSYLAEKDRVRANLRSAKKELQRLRNLRAAKSISETEFDNADFAFQAVSNAFLKSQAEIDLLEYQIAQTKVFAPFSGFVAEEHTQVGEWIKAGGPVVTLMDMSHVLVTVDVPERFAVKIMPDSPVHVLIGNISEDRLFGEIYAMLQQGNPNARTIPIRVKIENPEHRIRAGMEAHVSFDLADKKEAMLVPKDAVVTAGDNRMVYAVIEGKAVPVGVQLQGYYAGDVAVSGKLTPEMAVVIRGNERLRPGQAVAVENTSQ